MSRRFADCPKCGGVVERNEMEYATGGYGDEEQYSRDCWCSACGFEWIEYYSVQFVYNDDGFGNEIDEEDFEDEDEENG